MNLKQNNVSLLGIYNLVAFLESGRYSKRRVDMRKGNSADHPVEVPASRRELRVERRFGSERKTRDMLQSLIRAHAEPA